MPSTVRFVERRSMIRNFVYSVGFAIAFIGAYAGATGVANAGSYINFGTDQAGCKAAASQANATGHRYSYCYQTGPGHYSLYLAG